MLGVEEGQAEEFRLLGVGGVRLLSCLLCRCRLLEGLVSVSVTRIWSMIAEPRWFMKVGWRFFVR